MTQPKPKPAHLKILEREDEMGQALLSQLNVKPAKGAEDNLSATLIYGGWGKGKTYFLVEAVLREMNVFVMTTELASNGLRTIREALRVLGKEELFEKHVCSWDVSDYNQVLAHLKSSYMEKQLGGWLPDVDVWEGFTMFQVNDVDEHVLSFESREMGDSELRSEGLVSGRQDWQAMKRGTLRPLSDWMNKRWGGKRAHKVLTMDEEVKEEDTGFGVPVKKIRPYLQGSAATLIAKPFDLIVRVTQEKVDNKPKFMYTTGDPSGKVSVKRRGLDLPDKFEADPKRVWNTLLANKGEKSK